MMAVYKKLDTMNYNPRGWISMYLYYDDRINFSVDRSKLQQVVKIIFYSVDVKVITIQFYYYKPFNYYYLCTTTCNLCT